MSFFRSSTVPSHVRKSPLAGLPRNELRQLDQIGTLLTVAPGETIISEDTTGRECFVIVDGEFSVQSDGVQAAVGAGDVAGELALLTGEKRNASVVADTEASVYVFTPREFATLLSEAPKFCSSVITSARSRLADRDVKLPAQFVRRYEPLF